MTITEIMAVPPPEPERPKASGPGDWVRRNLFHSVGDGVITVIAGLIAVYAIYRGLRYVFVTGRWEIVRVNLKLFMVGRYPNDEMWRISVALSAIALFIGTAAGFAVMRRRATGRTDPTAVLGPWWRHLLATAARLWPLILGVAILLSMVTSSGPWLTVLAVIAAGIVGRLLGPFLPGRSGGVLILVAIAGFVGLILFLRVPIDVTDWGGVMLNIFLAAAGISLCFPLGLLLALGRRSKLPLIRWLSVTYIELFRGVPLYVLLLLAYFVVPLFLPSSSANPSLVLRAIVAITFFTAAYVAEIVRGGLQSLPRGQTEAAQALGLSPVKTMVLIVLPQALRNVIPSLVGQFISLFKDTTLAAAAMGLLDLLRVSDAVVAQTGFAGQGLTGEALTFVMLLFWVGCITMSRESQRLERKLGVGTR
ncbi:MAG: amino acid ABC transporter permease [Ilumatobacteraceae bacterium]